MKKRSKVGDLLLRVEYSSHALARLKVRNIKGDEDIFMELGENGEVMGIEIWRASKNILEPISKTIASKIKELIPVRQ